MAVQDIQFAAQTQPVGGLSGVVNSVFGAVQAWADARATRKALSSLSDRELEDIGLVRGDIESVIQKRFY